MDPFIRYRQVALNQLKVATRRVLSAEFAFMADTAEFNVERDYLTDQIVMDMCARVLAEQLPPQTIDYAVRVETTDPRFATWWDHYKATHRARWWMRWRSWSVAYVDTIVAIDRIVTVAVRDNWTYPRAAVRMPDHFGAPVLVSLVESTDLGDWRDV